MLQRRLTRRDFMRSTAIAGAGLAAVACVAPGAAPAGEEAAAPASETTVVRFMSRAGADNIPNAEKVLGEDFRAEYPDIEVAVEPAPDGWI
ncbi:MAG TPA: twin-arginine translocation signal domain-containing protein, partial [Caldilineaceae bacterium]|nr:twin-arginine translocation signal domain-containing protein [Caldilineaceae bacterium]